MVVEYFGEETIKDRYKYLYDKMQVYITERGQSEQMYINSAILQQTVMDYFTDIYRLKEFHKIQQVNIIKIVAYEVYWILRRKPIQLVKDVEVDSKMVFANEGFLTTFVAHECLVPTETEPLSDTETEEFLKYLKHMNYHMKYRNLDKQDLELMLYSFETGKNLSI